MPGGGNSVPTNFLITVLNPNSEVETGSAPASGAIFRAHAENPGALKKHPTFGSASRAKMLAARRVRLGRSIPCPRGKPGHTELIQRFAASSRPQEAGRAGAASDARGGRALQLRGPGPVFFSCRPGVSWFKRICPV